VVQSVKPVQLTQAKSLLFQPVELRSVTARNAIAFSPLSQYSCHEGVPGHWHMAHLGARAMGGAGIVMVEATGVEPRGLITPGCTGLWNEKQRDAFAEITAFIHEQGAVPGIQLNHAGRKAGQALRWLGRRPLTVEEGAWPVCGPSAIAFNRDYPVPSELSEADIGEIATAFGCSARYALQAGFQLVEIHAAHGFLLHQFLSPLSNERKDQFGGSLVNRARALMMVLDAVRAEWPEELPLFVRFSCTDWVTGGWDLEQSVDLARMLAARGDIDLVDCSSGGLHTEQSLSPYPGYQVPFAQAVRQGAGIPTAAVGLIRTPRMAEEILLNGQADLIMLGRLLLDDPHWPLHAARELGVDIPWPKQYIQGNIIDC